MNEQQQVRLERLRKLTAHRFIFGTAATPATVEKNRRARLNGKSAVVRISKNRLAVVREIARVQGKTCQQIIDSAVDNFLI